MSPVITFPGTIWLSWNSARLVSLILNSLTGSLLFYEQQQSFLTPDSIFGLRIIEGQLDQLYIHLKDRGHHKDIFAAIRNLSNKAAEIASKANNKIKTDARLSPHFEIFEKGFNFKLSSAKLIDDRFRWHVKEHFTEKKSRKWFDGGNKNDLECIYNLLENFPSHSLSCQESMLKSGLNGYELTTQVFYLTISQQIGCTNFLNSTIYENNNYSLNHQILEFCTNIFGELSKFKKDKKKLAKIDWKNLDLMMEQIFICSLHGFVEFVDTHFIVAGLSWQNPKFGCWKKEKPAHLPKFGYENDFRNLEQKNETADDCIAHLTTVTIGALIMALKFLLDPPPWPEFHHAADQLISADTIVAEEKFHIFKYIDWVRDIPGGIHLPRPPPVTWAPDLIAFVFLLLILLIGSIIAHNFCSSDTNLRYGKRKKLYNFAYKKL